MHPHKEEIRRRILQQRSALTHLQVQQGGDAVRRRLMETDLYDQAQRIGCYVSVKSEVDTHGFIEAALSAGKRVAVPRTRRQGLMVHQEIQTLADLRPAPFGLLEPTGSDHPEIPPADFDLIIVPGLAFDRRGNRIGFGAGYYDRFLARVTASKIGLAYDFQILDHLPSDPHDIRLDLLVTEREIHTCKEAAL